MSIQEHLDGFLLELISVRPTTGLGFGIRWGHRTVLLVPLRIRNWTVQKTPSTSPSEIFVYDQDQKPRAITEEIRKWYLDEFNVTDADPAIWHTAV
jgi:hypothetical protein